MKALSWINIVLGAWLIVTGFAVSNAHGAVMAEEIVLGCAIAVLAWISAVKPYAALSWLIALAGLWTLVAPQFISYAEAPRSRTTDVVTGIIVLIVGVINALYRRPPIRAGV
jgi:hypothetical protein